MLTAEFQAEWTRQHEEAQAQAANGWRGYIPAKLEHHEMVYLMAFYGRSELDEVVQGLDRHAHFVAWCRTNAATLLRDVESDYWTMIQQLQCKATGRPIAKEWKSK